MKLHFILNATAKSGNSSLVWSEVESLLKNEQIDYEVHPTTYEGAATDLAKDLSHLPDEKVYLIAMGGDGTLNEVLNGIGDFDKVRLGLIPVGSGNDFARGIGLSFGTDGLRRIIRDIEREQAGETLSRIDLGQASFEKDGQKLNRLYGISSGIGMDALVCKETNTSNLKRFLNKINLGQLTYVLLTIYCLFSMETAETEIVRCTEAQDDFGEKISAKKMIFAAAMNLFSEGGGVPMAPKATPYDGKLSLCVASGIPKWLTFLMLPVLVMGKHEKVKGFSVYDATSFHIKTSRPMALHTDGEYLGDICDVVFSCCKEQLFLLGRK